MCGWTGAAFYVSNDGNDAWNGQAPRYAGGTSGPWKTLEKVNQTMPQLGGQSVFFRRGDYFTGRLEIVGTNINFGAYGEGCLPILSGARPLPRAWSSAAGRPNVYQNVLPSDVEDVTLLMYNAISLPLGRTPNGDLSGGSGYYTFSRRTDNSIMDPELTDADGLVGAEIILRKDHWTYAGYRVTAVNGTTVTFDSADDTRQNQLTAAGYFFQKHLAALDTEGEWFFDKDSRNLYIYSAAVPTANGFKYSAESIIVQVRNATDITLQDLKIEMAASLGVNIDTSTNVTILNCEIAWCGQEGVRIVASPAWIKGNHIRNCLAVGVSSMGSESRVVVTHNTISNIGMIPGRGQRRHGIMLMGGNSEASYNRLSDIGYIGIRHAGRNNLIGRNVIERYNRVVFDGGAIYTYSNQTGTVIEENIILYGMANDSGLVPGSGYFSTGIQLDAKSANLTIRNNTIAHPNATGGAGAIHLNYDCKNNTISGNTILTHGTGISTLDRLTSEMSGNMFENNVIVRTTGAQPASDVWAVFRLRENAKCNLHHQGIFRNNVCAVPFTGTSAIHESQRNCSGSSAKAFETWFAAAEDWNNARSYAIGNKDTPIRIEESSAPEDFIRFFYNDSDKAKIFSLPAGVFIDPSGNPRSGAVTVDPWRSIILMKTELPQDVPGAAQPVSLTVDAGTDAAFTLTSLAAETYQLPKDMFSERASGKSGDIF